MTNPTPTDFITSAELESEHGIDPQRQLALLDSGKLTAYRREPGKLKPVYPSMVPPYANCPKPKRFPKGGLPVTSECRAEYHDLTKNEIGGIGLEQLCHLFFKRADVIAIKPQKKAASTRTGSKDGLYLQLDGGIRNYFENTSIPPSDPKQLDLEIWHYPAVKSAMKSIGTYNIMSLKSGLRKRNLGKMLPKLLGGRPRKAVK